MKKFTFIVLVSLLSLSNLAFSQDDGPEPMRDQPDGNCMTCDTCDDSYIICESDEVDAIFDKMNNCGPGSSTTIEILPGC